MLLSQLPALQHDPTKPEDVPKVDCDDADADGAGDACERRVDHSHDEHRAAWLAMQCGARRLHAGFGGPRMVCALLWKSACIGYNVLRRL